MFAKVLIANRGAIARRIARTLRKMRVASVAVYSDADRDSLHVTDADEAVHIGEAPAARSYLDIEKVLDAAEKTGAEAIHPGYGFLSENAGFAEACAARGLRFIGPPPEVMRRFGLKHSAREIARESGVPLLEGSGLLASRDDALRAAATIGYPAMLKATAGGGGIGMRVCRTPDELAEGFDSVARLGAANFRDGGVFLERFVERARHIEVQIFGDGRGKVIALGERDCSTQRRNQKVIEETPAPRLPDAARAGLLAAATTLGSRAGYASAGTVEFLYDDATAAFYFLEVNTRLQVEHGVTEEVFGVDLVEWMVRQAAGDFQFPDHLECRGHAIQARVYAENPDAAFQPSTGLLTEVAWPADARVETWVERGTEVGANYDAMLAKVIATGPTRDAALAGLREAMAHVQLGGIVTNTDYVRHLLADPAMARGEVTTRFLDTFDYRPAAMTVTDGGLETLVVDWPGRTGYWAVGVPPSGPMDPLSFRIANHLVGNAEGTAGLEITVTGPALRFSQPTRACLAGAPMDARLDGNPVPWWQPFDVPAGATLRIGGLSGHGQRAYLAIAGGLDLPAYLGSRTTFRLGMFGGHGGRKLLPGDVIRLGQPAANENPNAAPAFEPPAIGPTWELAVLDGPHAAPDFFTESDLRTFYAADWVVHHHSARTGIRLSGPKPEWARPDGGEAGLHPSNIHDTAYSVGAIDFTGDMPVILAVDGPSLGGFVCPATVIAADLWKIGQLRPGDRIRFVPVSPAEAARLEQEQDRAISLARGRADAPPSTRLTAPAPAILPAPGGDGSVAIRRSGDRAVLVEFGPMELDFNLRFRAHVLMQRLHAEPFDGMEDLTPGIRSLQVRFDSRATSAEAVAQLLRRRIAEMPPADEIEVPTRIVHLPLSWDDPATREAIERYTRSVRKDAPWCPSNIEFIRRINGLDSEEAVRRIVFDASYLVLGLGDVYLGAPVATPVDPRHRLVTTKYNPARTWTPENAVGIGGAYLCIYGMEGPGGYQFVGRTVPVWNRWRTTPDFQPGKPWLLRFFDQIRFYPVGEAELLRLRHDLIAGRFTLKMEEGTFRLGEYNRFLRAEASSIAAFKARQQQAFDEERERWAASGALQVEPMTEEAPADAPEVDLPEGCFAVTSSVAGTVRTLPLPLGSRVQPADTVAVVESMKMEFAIPAGMPGRIEDHRCRPDAQVKPGQPLVVIRADLP